MRHRLLSVIVPFALSLLFAACRVAEADARQEQKSLTKTASSD